MGAPEILRLDLGHLTMEGSQWPVHGFVILHERAGAILVDTGIGGPEKWLTDWRAVNRTAAEALAAHGLSPADVKLVINSHLHFDHCGQNAVFKHAPFYVQRRELERARVESPELTGWFDFSDARYELLDGDTQIADGVRVVSTPGHTSGHQCVVVETASGTEVMIGDAAYHSRVYERGAQLRRLPDGQAADREAWELSLHRVQAMDPAAVHFCHDTHVIRHR